MSREKTAIVAPDGSWAIPPGWPLTSISWLRGGEQLTRRGLLLWLDRNGVEASGLRLGYILMRAELDAATLLGEQPGHRSHPGLDEVVSS